MIFIKHFTKYYKSFKSRVKRTNTLDIKKDDDPWVLEVNLPSNDYLPTGYDFLFLVLDSDDPEQRLAEMFATDQDLLRNVPLEYIDDDLSVIIANLWLSDSVDVDGYKSSFYFNFNLDAPGGSEDVFVMLAARYHDPSDTENEIFIYSARFIEPIDPDLAGIRLENWSEDGSP